MAFIKKKAISKIQIEITVKFKFLVNRINFFFIFNIKNIGISIKNILIFSIK